MQPVKVYTKVKSEFLKKLVAILPVALLMHWTMQGMLYADPTERRFKLAIDLVLTLLFGALLSLWLPSFIAWLVGFIIAHSINFFANAQLCALMRDFDCVDKSPDEFYAHVQRMKQRAEKEPAIKYVAICGGIAYDNLHKHSDLDARIIRKPGFWNGVRSAWFLLNERSRALFAWFPLDMYLFDDESSMKKKLRAGETISYLSDVQ